MIDIMVSMFLVEEAKELFYDHFREKLLVGGDLAMYAYFPKHVIEVEKWAQYLMKRFNKGSRKVVGVSVWLHDVGRFLGPKNIDHAVKSEKEARAFLEDYQIERTISENILHCVRSHRNEDVMPQTEESRLITVADALSHFTDGVYINKLQGNGKRSAMSKLKRDYRDILFFYPKLKTDIEDLYQQWVSFLGIYPSFLSEG